MPKFTNTLQTTNPDGSTGAVFPGGLIIPVPDSTLVTSSKTIDWIKDPDGPLIARVSARHAGPARAVAMKTNGATPGDGSIGVTSDSGITSVDANAHNSSRTIIDSNWASGFIQLPLFEYGRRELSRGDGPIPWAGISSKSEQVTVNHGLQSTPKFFCFFMQDQSGAGECYAAGVSRSATQISAFFFTQGFVPSVGNNGTYGWMATT